MSREETKANGAEPSKPHELAKVQSQPFKPTPAASEPAVLRMDQLKMLEHQNNSWFFIAPEKVKTPQDVLDPVLLSAVADQFLAHDLVRVVAKDESWLQHYFVKFARIGYAVLVPWGEPVWYGEKTIDSPDRLPPGVRIYRGAPDEGWVAEFTKPNGDIVILGKGVDKGWNSREEAIRYAADHAAVRQGTKQPQQRYT